MPKSTPKQTLKEWQEYAKMLQEATPLSQNETEAQQKDRIQRLLGDFSAFAQYYFPNYCTAAFADFHLRLAAEMSERDTVYAVRAWAREHAKSVVAGLMIPLFLKMNGQLRNMLLVSNSQEKALELLLPLQLNLEHNLRLKHDFGEQKTGSRRWEQGNFVCADGSSFRALGAGQSPRGSRNEAERPDFILIDDIDTDEESRNLARSDKKWQWVEQALFPAMSITGRKRFLIVGNIISPHGCVARAMQKADSVEQINLLTAEGTPAWASRYSPEQVTYMLSKISYASAQKEYFNNPISEGTVFEKMQYAPCPALAEFPFLVCYTDPSYTENARSDYKATVLVGQKEGIYYILKAFVEQCTIAKMVAWHYEIQAYVGDQTPVYYHIEASFLQDVFLQAFQQAGNLPIQADTRHKPDKFHRIEALLEPLNRRGKLLLNETERLDTGMQRLAEQFRSLEPNPLGGTHDDAPDAVEGAIFILQQQERLSLPRAFVVIKH